MNALLSFVFPDQVLLWATNVLIHATVLAAISLLIALLFRKVAVTRYWILCLAMLLVLGSPLISAFIQSQGNSLLTLALPVEGASNTKLLTTDLLKTDRLKPTLLVGPATQAGNESPDSQDTFDFNPVSQSTSIQSLEEPALRGVETEATATPIVSEPVAKVRSASDWLRFILTAVIVIWATGTTIMSVRMLIGWIRMARILKQAQPNRNVELQRAFEQACAAVGCTRVNGLRFVVSDAVSGPIAAGIFSGTIVLPSRLVKQVDAANLADVLVHEVAHVVRRDQIVVLVQNLVTAFYWPHPLVKSLNRELAKAREEVCDNFVLAGTEAPDYSRTLLSLAELVQRPEALPGSVGFFTDRWKLEHRVAGLLDTQRDRKTFLNKRSWAFLLATTLLLAAMTCVGTITFATAKQVDTESSQVAEIDKDPTVRGVVLKPDGSPAAGATIRAAATVYGDMRGVLGEDYETPMKEVVADKNGKFEITIDSNPYEGLPVKGTRWEDYWKLTVISATMPDFAGQWVLYKDIEEADSITLQLVEDTPIRGRVIGLEGRPVSDVSIEVKSIFAPPSGSLDAWLKSVRNDEPVWVAVKHVSRYVDCRSLGVPTTTKTDKDGVFEIKGIGRERCLRLHAHGNGIALENFQVVTRPMEPLAWNDNNLPDATTSVFGEEFTLAGRPSRVVTGTLTDAKTGMPLSNVDVAVDKMSGGRVAGMWLLATKTDSKGQYRFDGIPKGKGNQLMIRPADDQPYFQREIDVPNPDGIDPMVLDVELHRGIWIQGKVVDKQSREPVAGVRMHYLPLRSNKFTKGLPEFKGGNIDGVQNRYNTDANGKYRLVGLPGPAVIGANSINKLYRSGVGFEELNTPANNESGWLRTYRNPLTPGLKWPNSMVQITPNEETQKIQVDLELDPGLTVQAKVVDENGQWLTGADVDAGAPYSFKRVTVKSGPVDISNLAPNESRVIIVHHKARGLGVVHHLTAEDIANGKVTLTARHVAKVSGRLVNEDGPISGISVIPDILPSGDFSSRLATASSDENGFFQTVLIPGCKYKLRIKISSFDVSFFEEDLEVTSGDDIELGTIVSSADRKFKRTNESEDEKKEASAEINTKAIGVDSAKFPPVKQKTTVEPLTASNGSDRAFDISGAVTENGQKVQVTLPDGKAAARAQVTIIGDDPKTGTTIVVLETTTDTNGECSLGEDTLPKDDSRKNARFLIARSEGFGISWMRLGPKRQNQTDRETIEVKLSQQEIIEGKLIDIEGQPVAGETLRVDMVKKLEVNPQSFSTAFRLDSDQRLRIYYLNQNAARPLAWLPSVTSDAAGRFKLTGVPAGHGLYVSLINSRKFAPQGIAINTHQPGQRHEDEGSYLPLVKNLEPDEEAVVVLSPGKVFTGVVTFEDTGKPVADAKVSIWASQEEFGSMASIEGRTDAEGRYRMLPKPGIRFGVSAYPPSGVPYMARKTKRLTWENGDLSREVDIKLPRVVLVRGRVLEEGTGKPVEGATITYESGGKQTEVPKNAVTGWQANQTSDANGHFMFAVPPGRGTLLVKKAGANYVLQQELSRKIHYNKSGGTRVYAHALHEFNASMEEGDLDVEIQVKPGRKIEGEIVDEDGKLIESAVIATSLRVWDYDGSWRGVSRPDLGGRFKLIGLSDDGEYPVVFLDPIRKLGATLNLHATDDNVKVVLKPCGTARAKFILDDEERKFSPVLLNLVVTPGTPRRDFKTMRAGKVAADSDFNSNIDYINYRDGYWKANVQRRGKDQYYTFPALVPGATYRLMTSEEDDGSYKDFTVQSGETLDLGEFTPKFND